MDALIRLLLRFILVPLGTALALAAATAVIVIAHRNALLAVLDADPQAQQDYFIALLFGGPLLAFVLSALAFYTFVPAPIGILVSEALAIRSWMFHTANGGLFAGLGWALAEDIRVGHSVSTAPSILAACGLSSGHAESLLAVAATRLRKPLHSKRS